jgi:tetratricopeptide (TPR) repeat protein
VTTSTRELGLHFGRRGDLGRRGLLFAVAVMVLVLCPATLGCADLESQARALEEEGDLSGAVALYERVLESDPNDAVALEAAAVDLLLLGRYDEALPLQQRLVDLDPNEVQTRIELGFNYLNHQDRPGDAVRVMREAVALEPTAKNLTFLGQALSADGDVGGAEDSLRQAIKTDPTYAHSYAVLVGLLKDLGRGDEIAAVVEAAAAEGIAVGDSL